MIRLYFCECVLLGLRLHFLLGFDFFGFVWLVNLTRSAHQSFDRRDQKLICDIWTGFNQFEGGAI